MPIRIYALAKDFAMDNKDLVEQCKRIGILGKASALARLEDDEARRVAESLGKTYAPPKYSSPPAAPVPLERPTIRQPVKPVIEPAYKPAPVPLSLGCALAIDSLHAQVAEIGAIVESLILNTLETSERDLAFANESKFCDLIDAAFHADVFVSLTADDLHAARIVRNRVVHRGSGGFPSEAEIRQSRNAFVLAILDLLEYCGETLKAEVLSEFKQYFPHSKRAGKKSSANGAPVAPR